MKKYAFVGTHGAGKTTLVNTLKDRFLLDFKDQKIEVVNEVARNCPFAISDKQSGQHGLEQTYIWITLEQIQQELIHAQSNPNYMLCDRSTLDPLMYYEGPRDMFLDEMYEMALTWRTFNYDKVFLLYTDSCMKIDDDNRRCLDEEFRDKINTSFIKYFGTADNKTLFFISSKELFSDQGQKLVNKIYAECFLAF